MSDAQAGEERGRGGVRPPPAPYATFAKNAEEERDGITLREAYIRLLVLLWQDNEPAEVESMWRTLARSPGSFTADALDVLAAVIADPPADLVDLQKTHGWVSDYHEGAGGELRRRTQAEALAALAETRDRLQSIHDAEHPSA